VSTDPALEAALAAAGLAGTAPGAPARPLVVAGPDDLPETATPEPVRWAPGAATGVGSLPGTDPVEAAAAVVGELPLLPHLPELPARGVGADMIGRTVGLLVDLAAEVVPTGWRVTGLLTLVPSRIRDVRAPMAPMVTHTSRHRSWESGTHA